MADGNESEIDSSIPLSEMLDSLQLEIRKAHDRAMRRYAENDQEPVMCFVECELEFAIDVSTKAEGGFKFCVLKLGGGVKRTESNTIRVKYSAVGDWVAASGKWKKDNRFQARVTRNRHAAYRSEKISQVQ